MSQGASLSQRRAPTWLEDPAIPKRRRAQAGSRDDRLDRARAEDTNADHYGLGLSIVREITIAHDATLTANARAQGGLAFEIHFPLIPFAMPR